MSASLSCSFIRETSPLLEHRAPGASTPVRTRLAELAQLHKEWDDEDGEAPSPAGLARLTEAFEAHYPDSHDGVPLPVPYLYPLPKGAVLAEWSIGDWAVSLEIGLHNLSTQFCALNVSTGAELLQLLALAPEQSNDWASLRDHMVALIRDTRNNPCSQPK